MIVPIAALLTHAKPSSIRRTFIRVLSASGQPRGSHSARVVPRRQQPNDPYGDEERAFRAAFECRLAVVRAIVVELSPGRCDGAPRRLEVYSRDRDCTKTCGTFAPDLGTSPEDARAPFGGTRPLGSQPPWAILVAASRHTSYNPAFFCQAQRW